MSEQDENSKEVVYKVDKRKLFYILAGNMMVSSIISYLH
jgi:hypothetical protein